MAGVLADRRPLNLFGAEDDARVDEARRTTLIVRARASCVIALLVVSFTILIYDAFFAPSKLEDAVALTACADASILLLLLAIGRGVFRRMPALPFALLAGVLCNATEAVNLALTGGPVESAFIFPYYLVFFGIATLYPARFSAVLVTSLLLPIGYLVLGVFTGHYLGEQRYVSHLLMLIDYAGITCIANRVITAIFVREVRLRTDVEEANDRLRELDRVKSELFANVSHELRSPLTMILAPAGSLARGEAGPLNGEQKSMLAAIERNAARLLSLINDLLLLARLDAGRLPRRSDRVDLGDAARQVVSSMQPFARSMGLTLDLVEAPGVPAWTGDARHAERILINLVSNACKFSRAGGHVRVAVEHGQGGVLVSVTDQGIGIAPQHLKSLFDRFVQVESSANRRFEGTGIGLAIVKELSELHGGHVEVTSEVGVGSTFRVFLPVQAVRAEPAPVANRPPEATEVAAMVPVPAAPVERPAPSAPGRARVFVVEDNPELLSYLAKDLGRLYSVEPFADSRDALTHALRDPPDLVLSDLMMPYLDGITLVRRLRAAEATREVPILMLSAHDDLEAKVSGFAAGVDDYVHKPFQPPELRARIDVHLRLRAQKRSLQRVAEELRAALDQLRAAEATLVQNDRMAALGRLVAGVAHEINNPLHFVHGNITLLRRRLVELAPEKRAPLEPLFRDIESSFERIGAVARELLLFGRKSTPGAHDVDVERVVGLAVRMLQPQAGPGVRVVSSIRPGEKVRANPQDLFQITLNLLQNAVQAVDPETGEVRVESAQSDGMIELRVVDNGCGIPPENLDRIFEPFFTTKPPGQGTGLGLAIVHRLVGAQHGQLDVASEVGHGTTVRVTLPKGLAA